MLAKGVLECKTKGKRMYNIEHTKSKSEDRPGLMDEGDLKSQKYASEVGVEDG